MTLARELLGSAACLILIGVMLFLMAFLGD